MKEKRILLSLLSFVLAVFASSAHEKDVVERTFSFLKRVSAVRELSTSNTYAIIANDGTNMYAMTGSFKSNAFTAEPISSLTAMDGIAKFTLKIKDNKKNIYFLKNSGNTYGIDDKNRISDSGSNGFYIFQASSYYPESLILNNDEDGNRTMATSDNHGVFWLYDNYANKNKYSANYAQRLPAFIYEIDTSVSSIGTLSIATAEGYGTIYSESAYIMPQGITGYAVTEANAATSDLTLATLYSGGDVVPACSALLVKGAIGDYPLYAPSETSAAASPSTQMQSVAVTTNLLHGTAEDAQTVAPDEDHAYNFYKLYYLTPTDGSAKQLGFFFGAESGGAFKNKGGRAYLVVEKSIASQLRGFVLPNGESTSIRSICLPTEKANQLGIYTLSGSKLAVKDATHLPAGVYIINGVKTLIK